MLTTTCVCVCVLERGLPLNACEFYKIVESCIINRNLNDAPRAVAANIYTYGEKTYMSIALWTATCWCRLCGACVRSHSRILILYVGLSARTAFPTTPDLKLEWFLQFLLRCTICLHARHPMLHSVRRVQQQISARKHTHAYARTYAHTHAA